MMVEPMSRRQLVQGILGLASLAVMPGTAQALSTDDVDQFVAMAKTGIVENRTFLLRRPITLKAIGDLTIRNCNFICGYNTGETMLNIQGCGHLDIRNTCFDNRPSRAWEGIPLKLAGYTQPALTTI